MVRTGPGQNNAAMTREQHEKTIELTQAEVERGAREHEYSMWMSRYRAGNMSMEEWQKHLVDQDFVDWLGDL